MKEEAYITFFMCDKESHSWIRYAFKVQRVLKGSIFE